MSEPASPRAKRKPRGAPLTSERARALAIEREARRREARRLAATLGAKAAQESQALGIPGRRTDPAPGACAGVAAIALGDLVEVNGVLVLPADPDTAGHGSSEPLGAPRSGANREPAVETGAPSTSAGSSPRLVADQVIPDACRQDVESEISRVERLAAEQVAARDAEVRAEVARDMAEREAQRVERARLDLAALLDRIAHPERAENSLPWAPACPPTPGRCEGCGRNYVKASDRPGHAVESAQAGRDRCTRWSLGLP